MLSNFSKALIRCEDITTMEDTTATGVTVGYYVTGDEWGITKRAKYEWSAGKQI